MNITARAVLGLFAVCLLTIGVQTWRLVSSEREVARLALAPAQAATAVARAQVETVTVRLAARVDTVTRLLARPVRLDTLALAPRTAQDTARAVAELPTVAAHLDTLQRSCSALVVTCDAYRTAAERRFAADSVYRVGLEGQLSRATPGRLAAIWHRIELPLALAAGAYVGYQAGHH